MTELAISLVPVGQLKPYGKNAKKHPPEQIETLKKSIQKNGWTQPIVVDKDHVVIIGHGRRLAALAIEEELKAAGKTTEYKIPVVIRSDLSPAEVNALRLADNRVTSTSYDVNLLQEEISRLYLDAEVDITSLGFTEKELDFLTEIKIGEIDESVFADDLPSAIAESREQSAGKIKEMEDTPSPVREAFGFKTMTLGQVRRTKKFMTRIEAETGLEGAEALMSFFDEMGIEA